MFDEGIIDLMSKNQGDIICGGRHQQYYELFGNFFGELTSCGAELVFFTDLNVQESKIEHWLARRNHDYELDRELFDNMALGCTVQKLLQSCTDPKALATAKHALATEARKYGTYKCATKHGCDAELAKYARDHDVMAVVAYDTDFLIFEGQWAYWSSRDIDVDTLETKEFNRKIIRDHLSLTEMQLPLFATLMSNDHTHSRHDDLCEFHRSLGPMWKKWTNMADYVRVNCSSAFDLNKAQIAGISKRVFGNLSTLDTQESIRKGIESYDLSFTIPDDTDPLKQRAVNCAEVYQLLTSPIVPLNVVLYDMRDINSAKSYTDNMARVLRKSIGVIWGQMNRQYSFKLLAKWSAEENFSSKTMKPLFPPSSCE